jgi:hypothetical protein
MDALKFKAKFQLEDNLRCKEAGLIPKVDSQIAEEYSNSYYSKSSKQV